MANPPTVYITVSDENRNGKTLLARILADYLLLDGKDPFIIDTDAPDGPLRQFFPGRTALADFATMPGRMKLFDTILAAPGRDYVVDLPARHMLDFFKAADELDVFAETKRAGFRVIVFFVVDRVAASFKTAKMIYEQKGIDLFVAVRNENVGSSWPRDEGALTLPALPRAVAVAISDRRFSLRNFVLGDIQGLDDEQKLSLNTFLYEVLGSLNSLDTEISLSNLKN